MASLQEPFTEFVAKLRKTDFVLEEGYTFIDNGYKGVVPKSVIRAAKMTKVVNIDVPIKDTDQVVNIYQEALDNDPNIRVVVIGNFHKWVFAPWGCGFVWKNKKVTFPLRSLTSSSPNDDLVSQFCLQGTRDDSCYNSLPTAVEYIRSKGGLERISAYNTRLLQMASGHLISLWKTSKLPIPSSMEPPFLRMTRLPEIPDLGTSQVGGLSPGTPVFLYHNNLTRPSMTIAVMRT